MNEIIDYAYPCMMAENALRDTHTSILKRDYDAALEHAIKAMVECRIMLHSIKDMRERELTRHTPVDKTHANSTMNCNDVHMKDVGNVANTTF